MYSDAEILNAVSQRDLEYLNGKHRGGASGQKGVRYEDLYAVFRTAQALASSLSDAAGLGGNETLAISGQVRSFVDDVVIYGGKSAHDEHCQLRNTDRATWGKRRGSLAWNFAKQRELALKNGRSVICLLVSSNRQVVDRLKATKPRRLTGRCRAVHFPAHGRVEDYIDRYAAFADAIRGIHAKPSPADTDLKWLARCVHAAWERAAGHLQLDAAIADLEEMPGSYVRPAPGDALINSALLQQLNSIPDLVVFQHRGYLSWEYNYGTEKGTLPYHGHSDKFAKFEAWVLQNQPTNFDSLAGWLA